MIRRMTLAVLAWGWAIGMMIKDAALAFIIWLVALAHEFREEAREQHSRKAQRTPAMNPESFDILVPPAAGPVVETVLSPEPLMLSQVPAYSTKADAKRAALAFARQRTGNPDLQWKAARKLIDKWGREERALERSMAQAVS